MPGFRDGDALLEGFPEVHSDDISEAEARRRQGELDVVAVAEANLREVSPSIQQSALFASEQQVVSFEFLLIFELSRPR
jgi:hypothetical protein